MRTAHTAIKVLALCLAGLIIASIVTAVVGAFSLVGVLVGDESGVHKEVETIWQEEVSERQRIKNLEISVGATKVQMVDSREDEQVRVETNNEHITSWEENGTLQVVEKSHWSLTQFWKDCEVVIYVPENVKFEDVKISTGAGTLTAERLIAKRVKLELGAGKTSIGRLEASESVKVDGGAGVTEIRQGDLNNLKFDLGAGKSEVRARVRGDSKIDSGVGKLDLTLIGDEADYKLTIDKGLGSVKLNGEKQADETVYGQGRNLVRISSGVGAVDIKIVTE